MRDALQTEFVEFLHSLHWEVLPATNGSQVTSAHKGLTLDLLGVFISGGRNNSVHVMEQRRQVRYNMVLGGQNVSRKHIERLVSDAAVLASAVDVRVNNLKTGLNVVLDVGLLHLRGEGSHRAQSLLGGLGAILASCSLLSVALQHLEEARHHLGGHV